MNQALNVFAGFGLGAGLMYFLALAVIHVLAPRLQPVSLEP